MQSTLFRISNEEAEAAADLIVPNLIENIVLQYHRSDLLSPPKMDGGGADWYARTHYNKVVVIDGVEYGNYPYNPKYGYLKGIDKKTGQTYNEDCTNFASQILFEGGKVPMSYKGVGDEGPDLGHIPGIGKRFGWWWESQDNMSWSWSNVNAFKNYWGSGFNTTNYQELAYHVGPNDFIGLDFKDDGIVDHIGYVFWSQHYAPPYNIQIIQHSTDDFFYDLNWPYFSDDSTHVDEQGNPQRDGRYYRITW